MIIPSADDTCQVCGGKATGFHPYNGFCCPTHLAEAQAQFRAIQNFKIPEPFHKLREKLNDISGK